MSGSGAHVRVEQLLAHREWVRRLARTLVTDANAAEDLEQQVWVAALEHPPRHTGAARGWLATAMRHLALNLRRSEARRSRHESRAGSSTPAPSPGDLAAEAECQRQVVGAVLRLDEPYKSTVLFRWFDDLSPAEIAARQGIPVETVRTRIRRALEQLRLDLEHRFRRSDRSLAAALTPLGRRAGSGSPALASALGGLLVSTKAMLFAGAAAAILIALLTWGFSTRERPSAQPGAAARGAEGPSSEDAAPAPPAPEARVGPGATSAGALFVRGRIVDREGRPAVGMSVWVVGDGVQPAAGPGKRQSGNAVVLATDADGRFGGTVATPAKCVVIPMPNSAFQPEAGARREVEPPAGAVDFVVERMPTATLVVTAFDLDAQEPIDRFTCGFGGRYIGGMRGHASQHGRVEASIRLARSEGDTVEVTAYAGGTSVKRTVSLRADDKVPVRMDFHLGAGVSGRVVDADGRPLEGALVFFGSEEAGRGDEPFKPFDENRIRNGVRTDRDGKFTLKGEGDLITVWHPGASPRTVARESADSIELPPRGAVRGVWTGADGSPVAGGKVYLDRTREATTDERGRFEFPGVEAGLRGLSLRPRGARTYVAVRVAGGETADVQLRPGLADVRIELPAGSGASGAEALIVPSGSAGTVTAGRADGQGVVLVHGVLPGSYLLLRRECGVAREIEVRGSAAATRTGSGGIVVRARPGLRVYVTPAGAGSFVHLMSRRMDISVKVGEDGTATVSGLAPGRYDVCVPGRGVASTVEVADETVEAALD